MLTIKERRKKLDAKIKAAEAQLLVVQAECEHPNMETFKSYDYSGECNLHTKCPDCGYHKIT